MMGYLAASSMNNNFQIRASIIATYAADGRSGESNFLDMATWTYCNGHRTTTGIWKDIKNCQEKLATFYNDYDHWETDFYESHGDFWCTENGLIRKDVGG